MYATKMIIKKKNLFSLKFIITGRYFRAENQQIWSNVIYEACEAYIKLRIL